MVEEFLNYLRFEKNRSEQTARSYAADLEVFERYFNSLDANLSWKSVDSDVIRGWMESMMDKGNSAASVNRRLSSLRSFYRYALSRQKVSCDPLQVINGLKKKKTLPYFLKENEMDTLLDEVSWGENFEDVRARTILMVFYETGIRLSELTGLDDFSVSLENNQLKVLGKRNKQRIIPFGEELRDAFLKYIRLRTSEIERVDDAFFVTRKGVRMSNAQVRTEVKKHLQRVSALKKLSPHVLRHSFATVMLNGEAGLESVKKLLGHKSLTTTEIYTHTTFEQLKKVYKNAHPRE